MKKMLICLLILAISSSGCSEKKEENAIETSTPVVTTFESPLTGEEIPEATTNRPIAVMYNNHPLARPQAGLSKADIVYEVLAEGDITRLLAIFQSQFPEKFGPVRSARDYYIELAQGFNPIYICHGNSPEAKQLFAIGAIDVINGIKYDGKLFKRDNSRRAPHNSYITYDKVIEGATLLDYKTDTYVTPYQFIKSEDLPKSERAGLDVSIAYSKSNTVNYKFDRQTGLYTRFNNNLKAEDTLSGETITTKNVFIVYTSHHIQDDYGRRDIDVTSGGNGLLIQGGNVMDVTWASVDGRILPYKDGKVVPFAKGNTWIQVVPTGNEIVTVR